MTQYINEKKRKAAICLILCVIALFTLSGCRFSPKLQEVLYESMNAPIDFENEDKTIQNTDDAEDTTEDFTWQEKREEAERQISKEQDIAFESDRKGEMTAGKSVSSEKGVYDPDSRPLSGSTPDSSGSETNVRAVQSGINVPDDNGGSGNTIKIPDSVNEDVNRRTDDEFGEETPLPENVRSVAALGEMAVLVRMLGGENSVVASDAAFSDNPGAQKLWSEVSAVPVLMTGNQYMSDTDFAELLRIHPDAVIENEGNLFLTDEQIGKLTEAGIAYVTMPSFSGVQQIVEMVKLTGHMIGTGEAVALSELYQSWSEDMNKTVARSLSGVGTDSKYTVFLGAWDDSAEYSITANGYTAMSGTGAAVTYLGYLGNVINALTSEGGVVNTPSMYSVSRNTSVQYALPVVPLLHSTFASGSMADTYCALDIFSVNGKGLGSSLLPGVIAASPDIPRKIRESRMWEVYDIVDSGDQHFYGRGFLDQSGIIVNSNITEPYEIFVNPKGVGSWWKGSVESLLEPAWVASVFYGEIGEEEIRNMVRSFYSSFYKYDLNEDELSAIMQGYGI